MHRGVQRILSGKSCISDIAHVRRFPLLPVRNKLPLRHVHQQVAHAYTEEGARPGENAHVSRELPKQRKEQEGEGRPPLLGFQTIEDSPSYTGEGTHLAARIIQRGEPSVLYLVRHKRELSIHSPEVNFLNSHTARHPETGDSWLETVVETTAAGLKLVEDVEHIISIVPAEPGIYAGPKATLIIDHEGNYTVMLPGQEWPREPGWL